MTQVLWVSDETGGRLHGLKGTLKAAQCSSKEGHTHTVLRFSSLFKAIWSHQINHLTCERRQHEEQV